MAENGKGEGKKQWKVGENADEENSVKICGACVLISILGGDLTIIKAYFFKLFGEKRKCFWNMRRLPTSGVSEICEDISSEVWHVLSQQRQRLLDYQEKFGSYISPEDLEG